MHEIRIAEWISDRALHKFDSISPATTALIVVDMQVVFTEKGQPAVGPCAAEIIPAINRIAAAVRKAGGMVAFTRHTMTREGPRTLADWQWQEPRLAALEPCFQPGAYEHGLDAALDVAPQDVVVDKYRYSALTHNASDLNGILEAAGIDTVIITGVVTNCCCESTARDASMLGYRTFFISDANGALSDEEHNGTLTSMGALFADVRSTDEMIALIAAA